MKFSVKLIAAALCAAMLCVPALAAGTQRKLPLLAQAAGNATGAGAYLSLIHI